MNKAKLFKVATVFLAASFLVQFLTVVGMIFLKGTLMKLGVFGALFEIHEYNGLLLMALVLIHIFFNWGWIKVNILKIR